MNGFGATFHGDPLMREDKTVDGPGSIGFSRRSLLSGAAAAGAAGTFGFSALMPVDKALAEQVEALKADGWEAHPCAAMSAAAAARAEHRQCGFGII